LRQLLDCDFQNLTRRLRSAVEEAENALSSLKRRIEAFERISNLTVQKAITLEERDHLEAQGLPGGLSP
jgi:predicted phage tail protein